VDGNVEKREEIVDGAGGDHEPGVDCAPHYPAPLSCKRQIKCLTLFPLSENKRGLVFYPGS